MPAAQNYRKLRIPFLNGTSNFDRFPNHRASHEGDSKAHSITNFFENTLFVVDRNSGINKDYLIPSTNQRGRNRQNTKRSCRF